MMPMEDDMPHHAEYDNIYLNNYYLLPILNLARIHRKIKHGLKKKCLFSQHLSSGPFKIGTGLSRWGQDIFKRHWEVFT